MKKIVSLLAVTAAMAVSAHAAIVINEVYSGGGSSNASAAYKQDFVELFNTDLANSVDLGGYSLAYGSAASASGTFGTAILTIATGTSIAPGGYFVVFTGTAGTGGAATPTGPDIVAATGGGSLSASTGAIRLEDSSATPAVLDVFGYKLTSSTVNNFETAAFVGSGSVSLSFQRIPNGTDTNNNSTDFVYATPTADGLNVAPEPSTLAGLALGSAFLLARRRRRALKA